MIAPGNPSDLALASVLLTCIGFHLSRPCGVGKPIHVNSRAAPENDSMPASLISTNRNVRSWPRLCENPNSKTQSGKSKPIHGYSVKYVEFIGLIKRYAK